jgi:hypothetical protein
LSGKEQGEIEDEFIEKGRPPGYDSASFVDNFKLGPDMRSGKVTIETYEPVELAEAYSCSVDVGNGDTKVVYELKASRGPGELPQRLTFVIPHHLINLYGPHDGRAIVDLDLNFRDVDGKREYYMLFTDRNGNDHEFQALP